MKAHLITIKLFPDAGFSISLFNVPIPDDIMEQIRQIPGYINKAQIREFDPTNEFSRYLDDTAVGFMDICKVENQDVTQKIKQINKLLLIQKGTKNHPLSPKETYQEFIDIVLDFGIIYSTFIEIVLCNMFIQNKTRIPLRYLIANDINTVPDIKLNVKQLHSIISKLLGLLYEPNSVSISVFSNANSKLANCADTIFERLWKGEL
jgi:hypothetical protein